jgi:hypothetical protein
VGKIQCFSRAYGRVRIQVLKELSKTSTTAQERIKEEEKDKEIGPNCANEIRIELLYLFSQKEQSCIFYGVSA